MPEVTYYGGPKSGRKATIGSPPATEAAGEGRAYTYNAQALGYFYSSADVTSRGVLSVSIADFGASTDGANNATAIQAAIDAASAAGGGIVWVPVGTWTTGPLVLRTRVSLRGAGSASVLKLRSGANAHFVTLADANTEECGLVDLALDGNKDGQTGSTWDVVYLDNTGYDNGRGLPSPGDPSHFAERLTVTNAKRHGIHTIGSYSGSQFRAVRVHLCDGTGIRLASPDNNVVDSVVASSGTFGIHCVSNSNRIINCKVFLSGRITGTSGVGFYVQNVSRVDLIGCESQDNRKDGFSITGCSQIHLVGRADRNGLGPEPVTGYLGDGLFVQNVIDSRIDLIAGDRAAGADGNVGGGVTVMQRWSYNSGGGISGCIVHIVSGTTASGTHGNGSFGATSLVRITHKGTIVTNT